MVEEPPIHIGHTLDGESACGQRLLELGQQGIASGLQGGRLLRDPDIVDDTVAQHAADAGEPLPDRPDLRAADRVPSAGVVAEQTHRGIPRQAGEVGAGGPDLVSADGNENQVVARTCRSRNDADCSLNLLAAEDVMRP